MNGSLDPEERVLDEPTVNELVASYVEKLGWSADDDIDVEIGGMSVCGLDGDGSKWSPAKGTCKYNKDAFIVIKNQSRR